MLIWILVLIGLLLGVLVNYMADVLPETRSLSQPSWWPLSKSSIEAYFRNPRVLVVQLLILVASVWLAGGSIGNWGMGELLAVFSYFLLIAVIDIEHRAILHPLSLVGAVLLGWIGGEHHGFFVTIAGGIAGFVAVYLVYRLAGFAAAWIATRRSDPIDEVPFGFGDVNLSGLIGLLLGWPGVIGGLFLGLGFAGVYAAGQMGWRLIRNEYKTFDTMPLGPFLALGALATLMLGVLVN